MQTIVLPATSSPIEVYCELDDDFEGGGWTLVYSYGFTSYNPFNTNANAVEPIPTWFGFRMYYIYNYKGQFHNVKVLVNR